MNSKNSILLVDPAFDTNTAQTCSLLIKVTADNFSYAIIDHAENQLKVLYDQQECENPAKDLFDRLASDPHLSISFDHVKAAVYTQNSLAVPNDLYNIQQSNDYGKYFATALSNKLHTQQAGNFNFTSVFSLDSELEESLSTKFPGCKFYNHVSPLLELTRDTSENALVLDFTVGSVNVIYLENRKFIFQNYFEIEDAEEFNYYLLFMINQLNIDTTTTGIYVSGVIHEEDALAKVITKYFNHISFTSPINTNLNQQIIEDMPANYYSSLLALNVCE